MADENQWASRKYPEQLDNYFHYIRTGVIMDVCVDVCVNILDFIIRMVWNVQVNLIFFLYWDDLFITIL